MRYFLCQECGEHFVVEAISKEEAQTEASMWGGECIRELTKEELDASNPEKGEFSIVGG